MIACLRRDRVVALRQRERWAEAVAETQELRADGDQIPPYVREAEADSLLANFALAILNHRVKWKVLRFDPYDNRNEIPRLECDIRRGR